MDGDRCYAIAYRILRDADRAKDAVQQAFLLAWRELPRLREVERFQVWLYRLLVNACYEGIIDRRGEYGWDSAICSAVLGAVSLGAPAAASPRDDVFRGSWTSIDIDGSNQTLDIQGSGTRGHHAMFAFDDSATGACGGSPAHLQGSGVVDGHILVMTGTLTCKPGGNPLRFRIALGFHYHQGTDTLTDDSGVIWYRA